MFHTKVVKL